MKIFISWSGDFSREVAEILRDRLRFIITPVGELFISQDLASGSRWNDELAKALEESDFGILCLTPENLASPWLNFEAGALTKHRAGRACGLLLGGLKLADVRGPLSQFQHREFVEGGLKSLAQDVNRLTGAPLREDVLSKLFSDEWSEIEQRYAALVAQYARRATKKSPATVAQTLTVPKLPIQNKQLDELADEVESVRRECLRLLRERHAGNLTAAGLLRQDDAVRANVFLADYRGDPPIGCAFQLKMQPRLRKQMNRPEEWEIDLLPGEGATGTVFIEGQQRALQQREFQLSAVRIGQVHPDLKWLVSTPLKGEGGRCWGCLMSTG